MDSALKPAMLLTTGLLLWLFPPAARLGKVPAAFAFTGAVICFNFAAMSSKRLIREEQRLAKVELLDRDLENTAIALEASQRESELHQLYLSAAEPELTPQPQPIDPRQSLEQSWQLTELLTNELINRQRSAKSVLLSKGARGLRDYLQKKGKAIDVRSIAKNWGRNQEPPFNQKEVESFCQELVRAEVAVWTEDGNIQAI